MTLKKMISGENAIAIFSKRKGEKMSNRTEITALLSLSAEKYINPHDDTRIYWAKEVTFDYSTNRTIRVDYMKFNPINNTVSGIEKGDFYCYEIKSSVEDFHSKNGHNFVGDYNYYVMPEDVYERIKSEIPHFVGVLVPDKKHYQKEWYDLKSVKKAWRKDRDKPALEMLLMMFRSAKRDTQAAFDKEKVIEELDNCRKIMLSPTSKDCFGGECKENDCLACVFNKAMEVIEKGGIEEE